jgi:hypothetical protein
MCKQPNILEASHSPKCCSKPGLCCRGSEAINILLFLMNVVGVKLEQQAQKEFVIIYLIRMRHLLLHSPSEQKMQFLKLFETLLFDESYHQPSLLIIFRQLFPFASLQENTKLQTLPQISSKDIWFVNIVGCHDSILDDISISEHSQTSYDLWKPAIEQLVLDHPLGETLYKYLFHSDYYFFRARAHQRILDVFVASNNFLCNDIVKNVLSPFIFHFDGIVADTE